MTVDVNWVIALSTIILVLITAYYAYVTNRMLKQSERQFEADSRPYILLEVQVKNSTDMIMLKISNHGKSTAERVKFELIDDFFVFGDPKKNLKNLPIFQDVIEHIPPGFELLFHLDQGHKLFDKNTPKELPKLQCNIEYSFNQSRYIEKVILTFDHLEGASIAESYQEQKLRAVIEMLRKIKEELKRMNDIEKKPNS